MSRAILEFELPEERAEFAAASNAGKLVTLIEVFSGDLRNLTKYGDGKPVTWEAVREKWLFYVRESAIPEEVGL